MVPFLLLLLLGLAIGFLVGLTGTGGGALLTPILILLNFPALTAVGSDLLFNTAVKGIGAFLHHRELNVDLSLLSPLLLGATPALLLGWFLLAWFKSSLSLEVTGMVIKMALGAILLVSGFALALKFFLKGKAHELAPSARLSALFGGAVALSVEMTSVGSGVAVMPYLMGVTGSVKRAVGTDIAYSFFVSLAAGLLHFSLGNVSTSLVLALLLGAIPATALGVRVASRTGRHELLGLAVSLIMLLSGIALLYSLL